MGLSGLKIYQDDSTFPASPAYQLGLVKCELEVKDNKDIKHSKSGKPLSTFQHRTYKVEIESNAFYLPTNYLYEETDGSQESIYNYYTKNNNFTESKWILSKTGLYTYLRKRRFFHSVQGVFPSAYGDFEGDFKVINSNEVLNYGIIQGVIHLCIDEPTTT